MTLAEVVTTPEAADDAAPSVANGETDQPRPRRKRKATGTRRREEIEALEQEVKALQAQVADLQKKAEAEGAAKAEVKRSEMEQEMQDTGFIRQAVLQQQASLVNVQSALSRLTMTEPGAPHATSIRLGTDLKERWATLTQMKPVKLQAAQFYLRERGRFVDDTNAFSYSTRFVEQGGCYCGQVYDVVPFEGVSSVKLVYDALHYYFSNMEIRVTESLGDVTIREDDGSSEPGILQSRFVSYLTNGPLLEMNSIICSEFKEVDDEYGDGGAVGIFTEDYVDQDDIYPYVPEKRIRQDATVVTQVRSHVKHVMNAEGVEEERSIVVMQRWAYCKIHTPEWPLSPALIHEIREKSSHWGDVKLDAVRELVYRSSS
ncbi:uncharacterized protein IUM83_14753 [Phytophthora cinnamomi]|uniref:uncharacterized protein n=1 Tax=Phytophthora cinnamomi TaxID=4785 RepID=UPI00355A9893|nr:hypothetical protein IUM83_14753 [Phytophthora cinnamomi]